MNKKLIKRIIIITVVINVIIALFIGGKITFEKSKEEIAKSMSSIPSSSQPSLYGVSFNTACTDEKDYHAKILYLFHLRYGRL